MGMRDVGEDLFLKQQREDDGTLRPTRGAEGAGFAGERDEELEATLRANSASETGFEEPTVEIPHHGRVVKTSPEAEAALEALLPQAFELLVVGIEKLIERG